MDKIIFEEGTLVTPAKVNEDGTITPAVWEGKTPLTPHTLNLIQDNIETAIEDSKKTIIVTDAYSSFSTYAVGDYCIYGNTLYKCTTAITTAENWNSAHWTATTIATELNSRFDKSNVIQENGTVSTSNVYSSKAIENLMNKFKKQIIWDGNVQVKTTIGDTLTLNDMPDLSSYVGKVINFYFSYGSDALTKYSIILTGGSDKFFYTYHRDYSGLDLWMIELCFNNLKSTNWTVSTRISIVINSDNGMRIDNEYHDLRLYRVEVEV